MATTANARFHELSNVTFVDAASVSVSVSVGLGNDDLVDYANDETTTNTRSLALIGGHFWTATSKTDEPRKRSY